MLADRTLHVAIVAIAFDEAKEPVDGISNSEFRLNSSPINLVELDSACSELIYRRWKCWKYRIG